MWPRRLMWVSILKGSQVPFFKTVEEWPQKWFSEQQSFHSHYRPQYKGLMGRAVQRRGHQHLWESLYAFSGSTLHGDFILCTLVPCPLPPQMWLWQALVWHGLKQPPLQWVQAANFGGIHVTPFLLECRMHRPRQHGHLYLDFKAWGSLGLPQVEESSPKES